MEKSRISLPLTPFPKLCTYANVITLRSVYLPTSFDPAWRPDYRNSFQLIPFPKVPLGSPYNFPPRVSMTAFFDSCQRRRHKAPKQLIIFLIFFVCVCKLYNCDECRIRGSPSENSERNWICFQEVTWILCYSVLPYLIYISLFCSSRRDTVLMTFFRLCLVLLFIVLYV